MRKFFRCLALCLAVLPLSAGLTPARAGDASLADYKYVLHIDEASAEKQTLTLNNANNLLAAYPPGAVEVEVVANIPRTGDVRLEASVVQSSGEVTTPQAATGPLRDLLKMEKQVVVGLAGALGYQLSEAERRQILENGTQNLAAFLAYSRGLEAVDAGNYARAAAYFGAAVRADPRFTAAQQQYQSASVSSDVQSAPPTQAAATQAPPPVNVPVDDQLAAATLDMAPTQSDKTAAATSQAQQSVATSAAAPSATVTDQGTPTTSTGTIHIFFRLP